jgi:hypothetical protein
MNSDTQYRYGCSEKYAELCALSTTGELTWEESSALQDHVAICPMCSTLLREYTSLAHAGMAKLAPELEQEEQDTAFYREKKAGQRLIAALHAAPFNWHSGAHSLISMPVPIDGRKRAGNAAFAMAAAAVLLIFAGGGFELGRSMKAHSSQAAVLHAMTPPAAAAADTREAKLQKDLSAVRGSPSEMMARSANLEKQLAELSEAKSSLLLQIRELAKEDAADSASLTAVTQQRDGLQQRLNDTAQWLDQVKEDLNQAQQARQGQLLRMASLEQEVNRLHASMAVTDQSASNDEQFLAEDRDIRELMGARQLYIADVFDVQKDSQRSKPFGRVFYTKGESLIFYAFDLQSQPGYHEAKIFQAWGKPDNPSAEPVSLGVFYMDSEKSRRWVVKSDDPNVLAQINAVFVTVEPHGGSAKPTGKPFLEAYLHSLPPNHP